ncbi:hypothetical protein AAE478_008803 [Parahypoxylon ruwenzoriense]
MPTIGVAAVLFSITASGVLLPAGTVDGAGFNIYNFTASCIPHSFFCAMDFSVETAPEAPIVKCSFWGPGPDRLPRIPLSGCNNSEVSFSFGGREGCHPLTVVAVLAPGKNLTGTYYIPDSDIVVEDRGSVQTERYDGPATLTISNVSIIPA